MTIYNQERPQALTKLEHWRVKAVNAGRTEDAAFLAALAAVVRDAVLQDMPDMDKIPRARDAIILAAGSKRPTAGSTVCPICAGKLAYSIASNGHVHAQCLTQDCVRWMEYHSERASFPEMPAMSDIRYRLHDHFEAEMMVEKYGNLPSFKATVAAIGAYLKEFDRCHELRSEAQRLLLGIRFVEDIQQDYPEAMRWVEIPAKPAPLMVRPRALKSIVEQMTA